MGDFGTAVALGPASLALDSHRAWLVGRPRYSWACRSGSAFGGSLRHLGRVVPAAHRGEVMSAYYVLAYSAMAVPTILAGWAATTWSLAAMFPWFTAAVALACLGAGLLGTRGRGGAERQVCATCA